MSDTPTIEREGTIEAPSGGGFLKVDRAGRGLTIGGALRRRLSHHAGFYTLASATEERVVFERVTSVPKHNELREPVVLQGDIGAIGSTIDVISFLLNSRLTGQLTCAQGEVRRSLYFKEGELCAARSNHLDDRLAEVLYRFGALERAQLDEAEREAEALRRPLGNHLVDLGLLNQGQLYLYFKKQVEEIFYSTLLFTHGDFYFTLPHLEDMPTPLQMSTQQLLLDGATRADDMRRFRARIPSRSSIVSRLEGVPPPSSEDLRALLSALRAPLSVQELIERFRIGEFRLYQRLFSLVEDGFVSIVGIEEERDRRVSVGELVHLYNNAFAVLHTFALQARQPNTLAAGLGAFMQFYGFADLFEGVSYSARGQLSPERLLENLRRLDRSEPLFFLGQALGELLYFQIFGARPWLTEAQREQLQVIYDELSQLTA